MRKRRNVFHLILSLIFLAGLVYLILSFSPSTQLTIYNFRFPILLPAFLLLFLFVFYFSLFIFKNLRRSFFLSLLLIGILFLSLIKLSNPFFIITLIVLFVFEELFFLKRQ